MCAQRWPKTAITILVTHRFGAERIIEIHTTTFYNKKTLKQMTKQCMREGKVYDGRRRHKARPSICRGIRAHGDGRIIVSRKRLGDK